MTRSMLYPLPTKDLFSNQPSLLDECHRLICQTFPSAAACHGLDRRRTRDPFETGSIRSATAVMEVKSIRIEHINVNTQSELWVAETITSITSYLRKR